MFAPYFRYVPLLSAAALGATLLFGTGCNDASAPLVQPSGTESDCSQPKQSSRLRAPIAIATYNVNWGNRAFARTARIILDAQADLVCIQESSPELERYLRRELSDAYPTILFRGDGDRFPAERFGLLSKHQVVKETFLPAKHGIFGTWIFELDVNGEIFQVANVHLDPVRLPERQNPLGILNHLAEADKIHAEEIAWIQEHLTPHLPTVIAGDFNSLSSGTAPAYLRARDWTDSFASVTESADSHATWRWSTRLLDLSGRIDYIFHTHDFVTLESRAADTTTSDHSLVVSRLAWRGKRETSGTRFR